MQQFFSFVWSLIESASPETISKVDELGLDDSQRQTIREIYKQNGWE